MPLRSPAPNLNIHTLNAGVVATNTPKYSVCFLGRFPTCLAGKVWYGASEFPEAPRGADRPGPHQTARLDGSAGGGVQGSRSRDLAV